ncbi:MAG: ferrous iron transport protein A [Porticoccaceae bacterium]|nr:ferrous iron transport protein A [Porticoccaceae bacterium]
MRFRQLKVGSRARVLRYQGLESRYRNRLMSLGLTPGTEFEVQHVAPLGDPIEIRVRGFHLSVRREEAGAIEVELV